MLLVPVSEMLAESWLYSCNQERECRIRRRAKGPVYLPVLPVRRYPGGSHPDLLDAGTSRCVMPWSGEWKFGRVAPYKKCEPNCSCGKHNGSQRGKRKAIKPDIITQHDRVRGDRGRADEYDCICGGKARDWANVHGMDRLDTGNYVALCRPCHIVYDRSGCDIEDLWNAEFRTNELSRIMRAMRGRR